MEQFEDIHTVFSRYNEKYFDSLLGSTLVEWSDRMTLCAGICYLKQQQGSPHCIIRLSRPLLQYRPWPDTLSTLLHEMIHAHLWYLQMRTGRRANLDRSGHGPDFLKYADRISKEENIPISTYHSFHAEVDELRRHIWKCNGSCVSKPPFYGIVRRAMNRAPQCADWWWKDHLRTCGGTFTKISSPPAKSTKKNIDKTASVAVEKEKSKVAGTLDYYWIRLGNPNFARNEIEQKENGEIFKCPNCQNCSALNLTDLNNHLDICLVERMLECPVCGSYEAANEDDLNCHIDLCLTPINNNTNRLNNSNGNIIDLT